MCQERGDSLHPADSSRPLLHPAARASGAPPLPAEGGAPRLGSPGLSPRWQQGGPDSGRAKARPWLDAPASSPWSDHCPHHRMGSLSNLSPGRGCHLRGHFLSGQLQASQGPRLWFPLLWSPRMWTTLVLPKDLSCAHTYHSFKGLKCSPARFYVPSLSLRQDSQVIRNTGSHIPALYSLLSKWLNYSGP